MLFDHVFNQFNINYVIRDNAKLGSQKFSVEKMHIMLWEERERGLDGGGSMIMTDYMCVSC